MGYLATANLKLALDTGLVWRIARDPEGDDIALPLGSIEDEDGCPAGLAEEWHFLRIEWEDAVRCGEAYRAVLWDPCCN